MSSFSYNHQPFFFVTNSANVPSTLTKMSLLLEEGTIETTTTYLSPIYPNTVKEESPLCVHVHERVPPSQIGPCLQYTDSSSMVVEVDTSGQVTQVVTQMERKRKNRDFKIARELKWKKQKQFEEGMYSSDTQEKQLKDDKKDKKRVPQVAPSGYVHVRARRGQATDNHSLAERVRREKISERMRLLQSLVPGCEKITGKALILDEIINYIQSLQNQIEFLAAKLASVYPVLEMALESHTFALEKLGSSDHPFPSVIPPDTSFAETISASFLLQQQEGSNAFSKVDGSQLWDVDDQKQKLVTHYGLHNFCSF